ncbi:MAG: GGDEF domain-containing protein [Lachnospiraceae bacterium]|jgi:diguanylate cyclase (GGDEF)-like protein|nr:GGDEF domain-containing protein [Lachnospiraceae bacterium]
MLEGFKNNILYGGTDRNGYFAVKDKISASNRMTSLIFAIAATVLIGAVYVLSFYQEGLANSQPVYLFGVIFAIIQIIISVLAKKTPFLSYISVYMATSVFLLYGIAIATLTRPEEQTVTFMVLLIFVPLIFVDRPIRMAFFLVLYIVVFIYMAIRTKTGSVLSVDITDAVIFGVLAILSETVVYRAKIKGYVLENKLHIMSETDQLTGMNNRNCFEWRLDKYPEMYKSSICCIYIDANGLHELNNYEGHKAGDDMLRLIADVVVKQFGKNDTYRIGGDEYVAFVLDESLTDIHSRIAQMNAQIKEAGYHIAVGCEYCDRLNTDISKLIVNAETKMYKDKAEYYCKHDRRGR